MSNLTQNFVNPNNQPLVIGEFSIRQEDGGRYCLNDLHKASGDDKKHFPAYFLRNQQTKDLIEEIERYANSNIVEGAYANLHMPPVLKVNDGKNNGTYVVKELVYAYAMWISAKFHLMVIRAYDAMVMQWKINDRQSISPEQQALLHEIVARRSSGERKIFAEMWSRHNRHFKIARYSQLLAIHFPEAIHYLETMDIKAKAEKQEAKSNTIEVNKHFHDNAHGLALHMIWAYKWWKEFGPAIRIISPRMAGAINDHFIDGYSFATFFVDKPTRLDIDEKVEYYPWHLNHAERLALYYKDK